jgi:hypothetical protein
MSRRDVRRVLWTASLGLLLLPPTARAQQTEDALLRRIDSLRPLLEFAEAEADLVRERREVAERLANTTVTDTFTVGLLTIVSVPGNRVMAEELFRNVWESEFAPFVSASPSLEDHWFTFQWARELRPILVEGRAVQRVELARWRPAPRTELIRQSISNALVGDLAGTRVRGWASAVRLPDRPQEIYRSLALSPSRASRACLDGDALSCWTAMGLAPEGDSYPLDDWYAPEERRALVGQWLWRRQLWSLRDACVEDGDISSCDVLLADRLGALGVPGELAPLKGAAREALLWIALQRGGAGAWDRLRADPEASPAQALLGASRLTAEELSTAWLQYVQANRPASRANPGYGLVLALIWFTAFGTLASRSTRWR